MPSEVVEKPKSAFALRCYTPRKHQELKARIRDLCCFDNKAFGESDLHIDD